VSKIKCRILRIDEAEAYLLALKTNLMRRNLNPIEEAYGIEKLIDQGWSRKKIAENLNKSQAWISLRLKLVKRASKGLQNAVIAEIVTPTYAVKITELPKGLQGPTIEKIVRDGLNLQEVETFVNLLKATKVSKKLERIFKMSRNELVAANGTSKKEKIVEDGNPTVAMECKCGTKYIVDWIKKQIVSMEEFNGHRKNR
jgi:ParB-like chromosome segregation protein Spo0J